MDGSAIYLSLPANMPINETLWSLNQYYASRFLPASIFVSTLLFLGVFGNVTVISVYMFRPSLRTYGRYFIPYLAIMDIMSTANGCSLGLLKCFRYVTFPGDSVCKVLTYFSFTSGFASLLLLLIIAIQRYLKICRPFRRHFSYRECRMFLLFSFIVPAVFWIPILYRVGTYEVKSDDLKMFGMRCGRLPEYAKTTYYQKTLGMIPILEVCVLSFIYFRIYKYKTTSQFNVKKKSFLDSDVNIEGVIRKCRNRTTLSRTDQSMGKQNSTNICGTLGKCGAESVQMSIEDNQIDKMSVMMTEINYETETVSKSDEEREFESSSNAEKPVNHSRTRRLHECCSFKLDRMTTTFIIISAVGFLSYLPLALLIHMDESFLSEQLSAEMFIVYSLLWGFYLLNHSANPLIYGIFDSTFRAELKILIFSISNNIQNIFCAHLTIPLREKKKRKTKFRDI